MGPICFPVHTIRQEGFGLNDMGLVSRNPVDISKGLEGIQATILTANKRFRGGSKVVVQDSSGLVENTKTEKM